jgi:hypothetical protein
MRVAPARASVMAARFASVSPQTRSRAVSVSMSTASLIIRSTCREQGQRLAYGEGMSRRRVGEAWHRQKAAVQ